MRAPRAVLSLEGARKRFGAVAAVDDVSLDLVEGEFFALLGPSGCGKTTLLRILAGFEKPDEGRLLLDGEDITALRPNRRPINLMFQSYALFPHMSVRKNIAYGLEMAKRPVEEIERRVDDMLDKTRLWEVAERRPDQLSGGQRQRVALARSLVRKPRVLLLDEPLAALDKKLREHMQLELKRLQHALNITFVVVTHDQDEALVMADRIALMNHGKVAQTGAPEALYQKPETAFVAGFIGVSNFFPGRVAEGGVATARHGLLRAEGTLPAGAEGVVVVRPERLTLSQKAASDGRNSVEGKVAAVAYHGQDLTVHVAVPGAEREVIVRAPASDARIAAWNAGQPIWCNWRPEHGLLIADDRTASEKRTEDPEETEP